MSQRSGASRDLDASTHSRTSLSKNFPLPRIPSLALLIARQRNTSSNNMSSIFQGRRRQQRPVPTVNTHGMRVHQLW